MRDARTQVAKGYGFVAFRDPEDYFRAWKEMNGKYIGNHPVQLKKATTDVKPTTAASKKGKGQDKGKFKGKSNKSKSSNVRYTPYDKLA